MSAFCLILCNGLDDSFDSQDSQTDHYTVKLVSPEDHFHVKGCHRDLAVLQPWLVTTGDSQHLRFPSHSCRRTVYGEEEVGVLYLTLIVFLVLSETDQILISIPNLSTLPKTSIRYCVTGPDSTLIGKWGSDPTSLEKFRSRSWSLPRAGVEFWSIHKWKYNLGYTNCSAYSF